MLKRRFLPLNRFLVSLYVNECLFMTFRITAYDEEDAISIVMHNIRQIGANLYGNYRLECEEF